MRTFHPWHLVRGASVAIDTCEAFILEETCNLRLTAGAALVTVTQMTARLLKDSGQGPKQCCAPGGSRSGA